MLLGCVLRFPSFVVAALQIAILSSLEYSPTEEATMDSDLDHVNSILSRKLSKYCQGVAVNT